jgi:hypothetical protein
MSFRAFWNELSDLDFNSFRKLALVSGLVGFLLLAGCGRVFQESPPAADSGSFQTGLESQCLTDLIPTIKAFMRGTADLAVVDERWSCFARGIEAFRQRVRSGSGRDVYTPREVAKFFEDFVLKPDVRINDSLLNEIMNLKVMLIGGVSTSITRAELGKLIEFAQEMRVNTRILGPYMIVFAQNWTLSGAAEFEKDSKFFEAANLAIQEVATRIAIGVESNGRSYSVRNFIRLMRELEKLDTERWGWISTLEKVLPLTEDLKRTLVGGDGARVEPTEWRRFALLASRGYVQYLRFFYFIEENDRQTGATQLAFLSRSIEDLFSYLGSMVAGKPNQFLTRDEIFDLLSRLDAFFPDFRVSQGLVLQGMKIKQVLFGGSLEYFVPADFERAKDKVLLFRQVLDRLYQYVMVYSFEFPLSDVQTEFGRRFLLGADRALIDAAGITARIAEAGYSVADLQSLGEEMRKLFPDSEGQEGLASRILRAVPVVEAAIRLSLGTDQGKIEKNEWNLFLVTWVRVFGRVLDYHYYLRYSPTWMAGQGLIDVRRFTEQSLRLISDNLARLEESGKPPSYSAQDIVALYGALTTHRWISSRISPEVFASAVKPLLSRVLVDPVQRLDLSKPPRDSNLGRDSIESIWGEFEIWWQAQRLLEEILSEGGDLRASPSRLRARLRQEPQSIGVNELVRLTSQREVELVFRDDGRLSIPGGADQLHGMGSLSRLNGARAGARLILRSYIEESSRLIAGSEALKEEELNRAFLDFLPLGAALDFLDPVNLSFPSSRFLEGSLFTPLSDGSGLLSLEEGVDLLRLILSGQKSQSLIQPVLEKECASVRDLEKRSKDRISLSCFLKSYRTHYKQYLSHLPDLVRYLDSLTGEQREDFFLRFLKATGAEALESGTVKYGDLGLEPHILQYAEVLMERFDLNRDGMLDRDEALGAYPVFRETLLKFSPGTSERLLRPAFTYLIKFGKTPETFREKAWFLTFWVGQEDSWNIATTRTGVAKIFSFIADQVKKQ